MTDPATEEYFEHIPWDELMAEVDARRRTTLRWAAGIAVAVVAAGLLWVGRRPSPAPVAVPVTPATTVTTVPTAVAPPVTEAVTVTTAGRVWAEADLRAVPPAELERRAGAYAEAILRDLFTLPRGDGSAGEAVAASPGARSFVEWVSVVSVTELEAGRFRVEAILGRLAATAGEDYTRIPPEGLVLVLDLSTDPPTVVDLPTPVPAALPEFADLAGEQAEPPQSIAAAATRILGRFGSVGELTAVLVGDRWRILGTVTDPAGVVWPLVVWLDDTGRQVAPGR